MKGFGEQYRFTSQNNKNEKPSKKKIIEKAFNFHAKGNIIEAAKYYQYFIKQGFNDHKVFSNYGAILEGAGNLKQAELNYRKAIKLNPYFSKAYSNLGNLLKNLGKFKEAELIILKAIELNPNLARAYFALSSLPYSKKNTAWKKNLFSESILNKISKTDQIDIYFARANIFHKEKIFEESANYLKLANQIKLITKPSTVNQIINKSKLLRNEYHKISLNKKECKDYPQCIFIVGMPRSGSTLAESILSKNKIVDDLGEINVFEETYLEWRKAHENLNLADLYFEKIGILKSKLQILTNKWLYNYQYAGIICRLIPNAKIIHCFRNPLDNILSIFRANFANGNEYSSSLIDCANVYLDQKNIMKYYNDIHISKIYSLNYDSLVVNPYKEIKSLISWLGWEWNDTYLTPHLNERAVFTASNVQVRSPINSKSINGWQNYKQLLKPAMQLITQNHLYQNLKY